MALISLSYIKVTITTYRDLFIYLVDYSALKRAEGLLKESAMAIKFWNYLWHRLKSTKLAVIFFSRPKTLHWKPVKFEWLCSILPDFLSAQTGQGAAGASLQSASNRMVGAQQWKLPWGLLPSLTIFSSSPSFPNKRLYKTGRISWIKWCWRCFHQSEGGCDKSSGLSSSTEKSCLSQVWGTAVIIWDAQCVFLPLTTHPAAREHLLHHQHVHDCLQGAAHHRCHIWKLQMSTEHEQGRWKVDLNGSKQKKGNREMLAVHVLCRVHLDGN